MKTKLRHLLIVLALLALSTLNSQLSTLHAQGTAFTYQGQLQNNGSPASGLYDFVFSLSNAPSGGSQVGGTVTNLAVGVTNGLFTTSLNFGAVFTGNATWLAISVRTNGVGSYIGLAPLQPITPTPYAIFANTASNVSGTVSAGQLSGTLPLAQLPGAVVTNNETSVVLNNLTNSGNLYLPASTATAGNIFSGGNLFMSAVGSKDFFAGTSAGNLLTTGGDNTGVGYQALHSVTIGSDNTAVGYSALELNIGNMNTAVGSQALLQNTSGTANTAIGYGALVDNSNGQANTAVGYTALAANGSGTQNTANGALALSVNSTGSYNTANGWGALGNNGIGSFNTANGMYALWGNFKGSNNLANGYQALYQNSASFNTAEGYEALFNNTTGSTNIALGYLAGNNITTGSYNIDIGNQGLATDTNITRIGTSQMQAFIAGVITGNGGGLTNLNTANFSGAISLAQLPGAVVTNNETGLTLTGAFSGNGAGLTNLNVVALNGNFWQTGGNNVAPGQFLGSTNNQPVEIWANGGRALRLEPGGPSASAGDGIPTGAPNVIGGSPVNFVASGVVGAVIGGGGATNYFGDGYTNSIDAYSDFSTIGGGLANTIQFEAFDSTIGGGSENSIQPSAISSTIGGGSENTIQFDAYGSTIGGGILNIIQFDAYGGSTIGGGLVNSIQTNAYASTISGGISNNIQANAYSSTISGGSGNNIQANAYESTIGGGISNNIQANADHSTIGGGSGNIIETTCYSSTIGGGLNNIIAAGSDHSIIAGGSGNIIYNNSDHSAIGGGLNNSIYGSSSAIAGGDNNYVGYLAIMDTSDYVPPTNAFVAGGFNNNAEGNYSMVAGGSGNEAFGNYSIVAGGYENAATGDYSFVAGKNATDINNGTAENNSFVWGDGTRSSISQGSNTFNVLATGGFWIFSGTYPAGIKLAAGSSSWATLSDRNAKKNFQPVNTETVLDKLAAIPIQQWNYKWEKDSDVPNIGPMAQDFKHAFYPGRDDKSITTLEFDGVELAAIQGLNQKLEETQQAVKAKDGEIQTLKQQNDSLAERLNELEAAVKQLAANK